MCQPDRRRSIWGIRRADWVCVGILLLLTCGFFWKGFLDPKTIVREDATYAYQPLYMYAAEEITQGRFPHWNPYVSCGVPFHAGAQGAVLYPLRLPLAWVDYCLGYFLTVLLHFFLIGAFTYLFMRVTLRCGPIPSLIGAISFSFGGFTLGHVTHPNWIQGYPWIVLTVFFISQAISRSSWRFAFAASIPIALLTLACAVHLLLVLVVGLGIWAVGETIVMAVGRLRSPRGSIPAIFWPASAIGIACVLGGAIAMVQLGPALCQSARSLRTGVGWDFITEICQHPGRTALRMVVPFYYGNYRVGYWGEPNFHELGFYAGLVPLLAAIVAVPLAWRNRWVPRLTVFIVIVAVIAAGRFLPVYRILYDHLPMFKSMRNPARFFGLVQFAIACLGAIGLQAAFLFTSEETRRSKKWHRIVPILVGAFLLAVLAGSLVRLRGLMDDPFPGLAFIKSVASFNGPGRDEAIEALRAMPRRIFLDGDVATWCQVAAGIASICAGSAFFAFRSVRTAAMGWFLVLLVAADLGAYSAGMLHHTTADASEVNAVVTGTPEHVRFMQENIGQGRYICWGWYRTNLDRFRGMQFRIRQTMINRGDTFLTPRQWETLMLAWRGNRRVLDLLGVRYFVTNRPFGVGPNLRPAYSKGPVFITENTQAFPHAFLTGRTLTFDDPNELFNELAGGHEDLKTVALIEQPAGAFDGFPASAGADEGVFDVKDLPGQYRMRTRAAGARQLVMTETYHPQWRCTIDGEQTPVQRTNYMFMSVRVPSGEHEILWRFEPVQFKRNLAVTLVGLCFVLGALGLSTILRWRKG
ncbi:MAG: YfhO family protein [Planctomycetes bacterium]|nr:YfhO family protein [Planctomycetota bacterium]